MKNSLKNNSWFSIVVAMWITVFIWLAAIYILEYIIPFGKNVKWIENASKSYYQANSWIEQSLWYIWQNTTWDEDVRSLSSGNIDYGYDIVANGSQIPLVWTWNSEYDDDFNALSWGNPVQLEVWDSMVSNWNTVSFDIRVPNTTWWTAYTLFWWTDPVINWQLSSPSNTLNSDGTALTANEVNSASTLSLATRDGEDLEGNTERFRDFYTSNCTSWISCSLKLTVISDLISTTWVNIPYLEYQINFWSDTVPLRFVQINTSWKSYGFRKDLNIKVPQLTVDWAFDFTVLQ